MRLLIDEAATLVAPLPSPSTYLNYLSPDDAARYELGRNVDLAFTGVSYLSHDRIGSKIEH